ncbi:MAG TPA: TetR/AcrR family transcriptional regulator [Desulfobacterales bacterium]|nr:TetR/AcrR family transcriptional regulator [Desulfobacterales bacterium]
MSDLKKKIIHESLRLFSLNGFLNTSMSQILEAAGTSKGGFYNHFKSKEELFFQALDEARNIWREKNLSGLDEIVNPIGKIKRFLENFRDRYLKDAENFPGGCIFITFSVELNDQRPLLSREVNKGFIGLKHLLKRLLDEAKASGGLSNDVDTRAITEMLFAGMLGATVMYGVDKSDANLDRSINTLIDYLERMKPLKEVS